MNDESCGCIILVIVLLIAGVILWYCLTYGCLGFGGRTPTPTPPPTSTNTPVPTSTPVPTKTPSPTATPPPSDGRLSNIYLELILDTSGSMGRETFPDSGRTKMGAAKERIGELVDIFLRDINTGLCIFGRPGTAECDTELLVRIDSNNAGNIKESIQDLEPQGWTPLAQSIRIAAEEVGVREGTANTIWVFSDGKQEGCEGDPCQEVRRLKEMGFNFVMHAIGMDVDEETAAQLRCIAREGNGTYYDVRTDQELEDTMQVLFKRMVTIPPADETYRNLELGFSVRYPGQWEVTELVDEVRLHKPEGDLDITVRVRPAEGDDASDASARRLNELNGRYADFSSTANYILERFLPQWNVKAADAHFSRRGVWYQALVTTVVHDSNIYLIEFSGQENSVIRFLESTTFLDMIGSIQFL